MTNDFFYLTKKKHVIRYGGLQEPEILKIDSESYRKQDFISITKREWISHFGKILIDYTTRSVLHYA